MNLFLKRSALLAAAALATGEVMAHTGGSVLHTHGFVDGALHPATGWDHALVALTVGLVAAQWRGDSARSAWRLPALFIGGMALGMGAGAVFSFGGWIESGILLSLLAVGLLLLAPLRTAGRMHTVAAVAVIGFAGAAHGLVHGVEAGMQSAYLGGVLAATVLLHGVGLALGRWLSMQPLLLRGVGVLTVAAGVGAIVAG